MLTNNQTDNVDQDNKNEEIIVDIENVKSDNIISDTVKPLKIYNKFLKSKIPIIGYIKANSFRIDLRAIPEDQINVLIASIKECLI